LGQAKPNQAGSVVLLPTLAVNCPCSSQPLTPKLQAIQNPTSSCDTATMSLRHPLVDATTGHLLCSVPSPFPQEDQLNFSTHPNASHVCPPVCTQDGPTTSKTNATHHLSQTDHHSFLSFALRRETPLTSPQIGVPPFLFPPRWTLLLQPTKPTRATEPPYSCPCAVSAASSASTACLVWIFLICVSSSFSPLA
jgi:hypothetical protein